MPRLCADILGPLCHGYKNCASCHGYLRISRVNATDIDLRSISVALTRDIRRYPWHWHNFCIVTSLESCVRCFGLLPWGLGVSSISFISFFLSFFPLLAM